MKYRFVYRIVAPVSRYVLYCEKMYHCSPIKCYQTLLALRNLFGGTFNQLQFCLSLFYKVGASELLVFSFR